MEELLQKLNKEILLLDGAIGTELQKMGLTAEAPEYYNISHPEQIKTVHKNYLKAGSDIIQTNSFGANAYKLKHYDLENRVEEINEKAVRLVKEVVDGSSYISGNIGPTGALIEPLGQLSFKKAVEIFGEQAQALARAGADLINIETMTDIREARAAVIGVKENTDLPLICNLSYEDNLKTVTGTDPVTGVHVLEALGVDIIGVNCTLGPEKMIEVLKIMASETDRPLSFEPNAGLPEVNEKGLTVFPLEASKMASYIEEILEAGASIVGGCCGSTPEYIKRIKPAVKNFSPLARPSHKYLTLASRRQTVKISRELPTRVIGERINPAGKEEFRTKLINHNFEPVIKRAKSQVAAGADILDINMDVPETNRAELLQKAVIKVMESVDTPLVIDTGEPEILEAALTQVAGKPLINSVTGEESSRKRVLPLARKYGAAVLGLTLDEDGIPETAEERLEIAKKIVNSAKNLGISPKDILIDPLTLAAGSNSSLTQVTLTTLRLIREELENMTVLGVSNISYGLPRRSLLNRTFLAMALEAGLVLPIINPEDEKLMNMLKAGDLLIDKTGSSRRFLREFKQDKEQSREPGLGKSREQPPLDRLKNMIIEGSKEGLPQLLEQVLEFKAPMDIINNSLIPGLREVGERYDRGVYFLPELIKSAETAQAAFGKLRPLIQGEKKESAGRILLATVRGDLHDIGKNIVKILLENHGFEVIDLGKNVKTKIVLEKARTHQVDLVGLSSLMTTTMREMKRVVEQLKEQQPDIKIMIGGAVVTPSFAEEIGADGYGKDAVAAVKEARELLKTKAGEANG